MGFYKLIEDVNGDYLQVDKKVNVLYAANFVSAPNYELLAANHLHYNYPVDGWYYFANETDMQSFFNLTKLTHYEM